MPVVVFCVALAALSLACDGRAPVSWASPPSPSPDASASPRPAGTSSWGRTSYRVALKDRGLLSTLDRKVSLRLPSWLDAAPAQGFRVKDHAATWLYLDGSVVGLAPKGWKQSSQIETIAPHDRDGDRIPDQIDILLGAKKVVVNGADYKATYEKLAYPGGDVPLTYGVCTDVVVRALRNAGFDLQKLLHEDIARKPKRYPMVKKANTHIDHRRVKTLLPYFKAHWRKLTTEADLHRGDPWLPGDIVFMQTMGDKRPDHLGIVSDKLGVSGLPLIINNWTDGYSTSEMDLLRFVPVTHRFRVPHAALKLPEEVRGLEGLLRRRGIEIGDDVDQVLAVVTPHWRAQRGNLWRFQRSSKKTSWRKVGRPIAVMVGAAGMGIGRGLAAPRFETKVPIKREGDRRSPAGLFALGTAFGRKRRAPYRGGWPYRRVRKGDVFVDDVRSSLYNTWQSSPAQGRWNSAEDLRSYRLAMVIAHNTEPVPKAGSAIFLHTHITKRKKPTQGCTAMSERQLRRVLSWLRPKHKPVIVQVPGQIWR